ncbi:MAG: VCBS repeat-containing protein [bacterium]|nr:VCBS repeat-containing protein [bacterium]
MSNPPSCAPVFMICSRLSRVALLSLALAICMPLSGSALAQAFICHAEPDSADAVLAAGGQAPYPGGAFMPALRVSVHFLRDDAGTGGFSIGEADSMLARMIAEFDAVGIQLIEVARSEIHDSDLLADPIDAAAGLFATHADSSSMNVFLGSPAGTIEGTVSGIPGRSLVLTGSAEGTSALSHFMGHCLGLYETDEAVFGVELPDGSNGATAGDLVTDTPSAASSANILEGDQVAMWEEFTQEQGARMRTAIELVDPLSESEYSAGVRYVNATGLTNLSYVGVPANATAIDFSGDGRLDLVVTADHSLFKSESLDATTGVPWFHNSTENMIASQAIRDAIATAVGVIAADYDNDGDLDLYFPRTSGHLLLRNESGNSFSDMTALLDNTLYERPSLNGAWGDYDADGFVDLVAVIPSATEEGSSALVLFHNSGGASFSVDTTKGITGPHTRLRSVLWGDLNFDQRPDLIGVQTGPYLPHFPYYPSVPEGISSRYWVQQSDASFVAQGLDNDDHHLHYRSCQAALMDVEPDGDLDLVYAHVAGSGHFTNEWDPDEGVIDADLSLGDAIFYRIACTPVGACEESEYRNMIDIDVCDFNLDGKPDFVAPDPNTYPYPCLAIHVVPPAKYTSTIKEDHDWYFTPEERLSGGVAVADFDENGSQDIYVARAVGTSDYFFRPVKSAFGDFGNWIGIKLRSYDPGCNRFALGATIVVSQGSGPGAYRQAQVVDGGSGRAGQTPLNLVYGLGSRTGTVDVVVYWPDGQTVQTYTGLAIGQYHTLQLDIQPSSASFTRTFDPASGLYSWEFIWDTDEQTPAADDRVVITPDPAYPACDSGPITLSHNPPFVTAAVAKVGSRYRHTMTWNGLDCTAPCRFFYEVSSKLGNVTWSLATDKSFKILYCASAP